MKSAAVTGATGFLGSQLVHALIARGIAVRAIVLPGDDAKTLAGLDIEIVRADITKPEMLEGMFHGVEVVFHAAALIKLSGYDEALKIVNVGGTNNVINACLAQGVKRLVYTSSIHALQTSNHSLRTALSCSLAEPETLPGPRLPLHGGQVLAPEPIFFSGTPSAVPLVRLRPFLKDKLVLALKCVGCVNVVTESSPIDPKKAKSTYARTKAEATLLVRHSALHGLETIILYPVGIIGPEDWQLSEVGKVITKLISGRRVALVNGGYFFVDVRDAARLHVEAALNAPAGTQYILSSGYMSVKGVVASLRAGGWRPKTLFVPVWLAYLAALFSAPASKITGRQISLSRQALHELRSHYIVSNQKIRHDFNFMPLPLDQSFRDTATWYQSHPKR